MDQKTRIATLLFEYSDDAYYTHKDNLVAEIGIIEPDTLLKAVERKFALGKADIMVRRDDVTFTSILNY